MSKKILFVLSVFLLVTACLPVKAALIAYYPFEGNTNDTCANPANGTQMGSGTLNFEAGPPGFGQAIRLNGGKYVDLGNPTKLDIYGAGKQFTIICWAKINPGSLLSTGMDPLVTKGSTGYRFQRYQTNPYVTWAANGINPYYILGTVNPFDGSWHHFAGVYDGASLTIYIDGIVDKTSTVTGTVTQSIYNVCIGGNAQYTTTRYWNGWLDEVRIYDAGLTQADILTIKNTSTSGVNPYASAINPANGQLETPINSILSWKKGDYAVSHNVYLSTNFDDVNTAQATSWVSHYQSGTTYNPGTLPYGTTYYWRIDEVNSPGTAGSPFYKGNIWSFTTDLSGFPIGYADSPMGTDRITPTASSILDIQHYPNMTIGLNNTGLGQGPGKYKEYYVDANHTTIAANNMWLTEPNDSDRWIQYVFDKEYKLNNILVWNYNETTSLAPYGIYFSKFGIKDVNIATTTNFGTSWSSPVQTQLKKATEMPNYQAIDPVNGNNIDMGGSAITGVTLQAINNWSDGLYSGYGLSEVMFLIAPTYASKYTVTTGNNNTTVTTATATIDPNMPNSRLNWKIGRDGLVFASSHKVYIKDVDNDGATNATPADPNSARNAVRDNTIAALTTTDPNYLLNNLSGGLNMQSTYYWRVDEVISAKTWANNSTRNKYKDIQSFKTVGSRLVTNFEAQSSLIGGGIFVNSPVHGGSVAFRVPIDKTSGNIELGPVDPIYYNINSHNWQPGNPTKLVLYFYGDPNNTGVSMYLKLGTTKIVYGANPAEEDTALLKRASWIQWNVPLTGITLSNVTEISYGVDIVGGTGLGQIVFDDLTLYRLYPAGGSKDPGTTNLLAYYKLNGNANDSSGNIRNGTARGTVNYTASTLGAVFDRVMDVNGGFIDLGDLRVLSEPAGDLTISFWTYVRVWDNGYLRTFVGNRGDDNVGWQVRRPNTNRVSFTAAANGTDAAATMTYCDSNVDLPLNQWIHIIATHDSVNKRETLYFNGLQVGTVTTGRTTIAAAKSGTNYYKTFICGRPTAAGSTVITAERTVDSMYDEVRFYDKVLNSAEILYLTNRAPATLTP